MELTTGSGRALVRAGLLLALSVIAGCERSPTPGQFRVIGERSEAGRFQVVTIPNDRRPFLVDTATGALWALCTVSEPGATELPADKRAKSLGLAQFWCAVAADPLPIRPKDDPLGIR